MRVASAVVPALLLALTAAADESRVLMPPALAARISTGARAGMVVAVEPAGTRALVTVSQTVQPLVGDAAYPLADPGACGDPNALAVVPGLELPTELARLRESARGTFDVVTAVVGFVSRNVVQDEHDTGPQDASSVLRRGRGRCSGRANLAVGLLRVLGVPAHVVHGLLVTDLGPRWHRWGEAWLAVSGWVPFDPGASVGAVSVRYLPVLGAEESAPLAGVTVKSINEPRFASLPQRGGMRVLPVGGATLLCRALSLGTAITAVLVAVDGTRWARRGQGEVVFTRMLPGAYTLAWQAGGEPTGVVRLDLSGVREVRVN